MSPFLGPLAGGAIIGLSASILLVTSGRIAGISGIVGELLEPKRGEVAWRVAFLAGLLFGALLVARLVPGSVVPRPGAGALMAVGGLLVGIGTQFGNGCTSGHGVCGLSRLSLRSLVNVLAFMGAGAVTVFVMRHVLAGG